MGEKMGRLIDADAMQKYAYQRNWDGKITDYHLALVNHLLSRQPSVDAVPVVRCKECRFHEHEEPGMVWCPNVVGSWIDEDGYCSRGERRESTAGQVKDGLTQKNVGNALESLEEMEDAKDLGYGDR